MFNYFFVRNHLDSVNFLKEMIMLTFKNLFSKFWDKIISILPSFWDPLFGAGPHKFKHLEIKKVMLCTNSNDCMKCIFWKMKSKIVYMFLAKYCDKIIWGAITGAPPLPPPPVLECIIANILKWTFYDIFTIDLFPPFFSFFFLWIFGNCRLYYIVAVMITFSKHISQRLGRGGILFVI